MHRRLWIVLVLLAFTLGALFYARTRPERTKEAVPEARKTLPRKIPAKIAIVLDDWGYNMNNSGLLDSINIALTISVLPNLPYSYKIAQIEGARGDREVILHMPMEPESDTIPLEKNTLLTTMKAEEIVGIFETAVRSVPNARGISNHMGSKATKDAGLVRTIMQQLKSRKIYFLDSMASSDSVCAQEAKEAGIRFAKRDIFLDNIADKDYIYSQLEELKKAASRKGYAVGIGHDRRLTLEVIKEFADNPPSDIRFVLLSEIVDK